ncbi:hypothetical protein T459_26184 [Capsicum annuum]|uniref:Uncharacterized protein n=1 Tax=Capsicum annuum TaxID=4072 RepID=A0A2G2YMW8_CAPAN|nr:hypothetical protein T459_26184 [Capsicum annuum]
MDTSLIHVQSPYIEMMKNNFFFFRASTKDANKTPSPPLKSKEVSFWRSVSLSSGSFYDSGSGKKNFTDLSKSPHGHSNKIHPKKSCRDSSQDLSVLVLIRTIRRLTKEKRTEQVSEENKNLRQQLTQLQEKYRVAQDKRDYVWENYQEKVKELKSENLLTTMLREKLYSEEIDIKQLQVDLAAAVGGNDRVLKRDKNINQLTNDLQEFMKELGVVKGILPKVFQERDFMWEKVKSYSEMNMLLNYEINLLKKKVYTLDEDFLMKDGQITILKDSIGKPFDFLTSPDSLLE